MFRKLKKIYFKIYHLFKLIGVFIVVFGLSKNVYAEVYTTIPYQRNFIVSEESCTENMFNPIFVEDAYIQGGSTYYTQNTKSRSSYMIPVKPSTTYSITPMQDKVYSYWISYFRGENYSASGGTSGMVTTFTTASNTRYIMLTLTSNDWSINVPFEIMMNEGSTLKTYTKFKTVCQENPTPDETYTGFLTLYLNRITYLAEGFTNNPYLIAMVSIIFGFVVLDILLKIIGIRRKK